MCVGVCARARYYYSCVYYGGCVCRWVIIESAFVRLCVRVYVCACACVSVCAQAQVDSSPGETGPAADHWVRRGPRAAPRGGGRRQRRAQGAVPRRARGRARQDGRRQAHPRRGGGRSQLRQGRRRAVGVGTCASVAPQEHRAPVGPAKIAGLARRRCCRRNPGRWEKPVRVWFLQACLLSPRARTRTVIHNKFLIDVFVLLL